MLDRDLAELYGVETKYLNRQVRRNLLRFPEEFAFHLTLKEKDELVTNWHRFLPLKHSSSLPYAFTEHGIAMLASVLNSKQAVKMSIYIIKTFVRLRQWIEAHRDLAQKLEQLEKKVDRHDSEIQNIIDTIEAIIGQKESKKIGFHPEEN